MQDQAEGYPNNAFTMRYVPFDATDSDDLREITRSGGVPPYDPPATAV